MVFVRFGYKQSLESSFFGAWADFHWNYERSFGTWIGRLFKIFPNLSQNKFYSKFGPNLSRLVYEWVTLSWKIGTCMGLLSNSMAANPYQKPNLSTPGYVVHELVEDNWGNTSGGSRELKIQTCLEYCHVIFQCDYFWGVKYQFLRILPPKNNQIEFRDIWKITWQYSKTCVYL